MFATLDAAARNQALLERLEGAREQRARAKREFYSNNQYFRNFGDRLVLQDLPAAACRAHGIPLYDWSRGLEDDEFADYSHPNVQGAENLHRAFLEIALPHLQRIGAWP